MSLNKKDIAPRFNEKLFRAIENFAKKFNEAPSAIRIIITPKHLPDPKGMIAETAYLAYTVYAKNSKLCDAKFEEIVKLDTLEKWVVNEKVVSDYIIDSLTKFSIGASCHIFKLELMIFCVNNEIRICLLNDNKIVKQYYLDAQGNEIEKDYFLIDKLF